jgi:tripartite-type tricarboxylate transporter receptor subunit TctC
MIRKRGVELALTIQIGCFLLLGFAARAQQAAPLPGGAITATIGFEAGNRVDLYGRILSRAMSQYLAGRPTFVIMNQPGAGGVIALNGWNSKAEPNGLAVAFGGQTEIDPEALVRTHAKYDPARFEYFGGLVAPSQGLFINKNAVERLLDKSKKPVMMGIVGSTLRTGYYQVLWGVAFLGWNVRWVPGYTSTGEVRTALERGEVDMSAFGSSTDINYLLAKGNFAVVSQSGAVINGQVRSRPAFGKAPVISDLVAGKLPDRAAKTAFDYSEKVIQVGMWAALPANTPHPIVSTYVRAFGSAVKTPEYRSEWGKVDPDSPIASRRDIAGLVTDLSKVRPATLDYIDKEMGRQGIEAAPR